ncbi:MAG: bifunctional alpha,alpha-trehalose-phosphate synthase (UDP-forming)/trehalose-phosphatase [Gaiella sp.]
MKRALSPLVVVANRLPVSVRLSGSEVTLEPSPGGLASALRAVDGDFTWVGWPGAVIRAGAQDLVRRTLRERRLEPVFLSAADERGFYSGACNEALWPLFHYFPGRFSFSYADWRRYVDVNRRFAEAAAASCADGGRVWIHDFQLMLAPGFLRELRPDVAIGFFLHIPFPSSEIYRLLPPREEVLRGLLGADVLGFHTGDYVRHFRSSCLRVLGLESLPEEVPYDGRSVRLAADPIGIDTASFRAALEDPEAPGVLAELEERYRGRRLVLGVERLDYTKGVPQKIEAFRRLLEQEPERVADTTLLQVVVPSRLDSEDYRELRRDIEQQIARVNGEVGGLGVTPIEYVHRSLAPVELAALYRRADVLAVTALRDGMNLVAQEFVSCQSARGPRPSRYRGALVLSELAGAAQLLPGALLVNPWDTDAIAARLSEALALPAAERRRRMELMAARVDRLDSARWAAGSLARLRSVRRRTPTTSVLRKTLADSAPVLQRRLAGARRRTIILDYDGTLRELVEHPDLAAPGEQVVAVLEELCALPATEVHVVSGRRRDALERWLGRLPVHLGAEHGYLARAPGERWRRLLDADLGWLPGVERILRRVAADVPGTHVERKTCSVAWHYRQAEPEYGAWRARELLVALDSLLSGAHAEVITGKLVVEVRASGINKGLYVRELFPSGKPGTHAVLGAGDDRTDLDMYAALPSGSFAIHVGPFPAGTALRPAPVIARSPAELRTFLRAVAAGVRGLD